MRPGGLSMGMTTAEGPIAPSRRRRRPLIRGIQIAVSGAVVIAIFALILPKITGQATAALLIPAVIGLAILAGSIVLFALALWKKSFARAIGGGLGKVASRIRKLFRKPAVHWGDAAGRFRKQTIALVEKR